MSTDALFGAPAGPRRFAILLALYVLGAAVTLVWAFVTFDRRAPDRGGDILIVTMLWPVVLPLKVADWILGK